MRTILIHRKPSNPALTYMHYDDVKHFELIMSGLTRLDLGVPLDFSFTEQKIGGPFARIGLLDSNDNLSEAMLETLCSSLLQLNKVRTSLRFFGDRHYLLFVVFFTAGPANFVGILGR